MSKCQLATTLCLMFLTSLVAQRSSYYTAPFPCLIRLQAKKDWWLSAALIESLAESSGETFNVDLAYSPVQYGGAYIRYNNLSQPLSPLFFSGSSQTTSVSTKQNIVETGLFGYYPLTKHLNVNGLLTHQFGKTERRYESQLGFNIQTNTWSFMPYLSVHKRWIYFGFGGRFSLVSMHNVNIDLALPREEIDKAKMINEQLPVGLKEFVFSSGFYFNYFSVGSNLRLMNGGVLGDVGETNLYGMNIWLAFHIHKFFQKKP